MSLRGRELLTADQREEYVKISVDISEHELGAFYTLSQFDHEIIKRHRRFLNQGHLIPLLKGKYLMSDNISHALYFN